MYLDYIEKLCKFIEKRFPDPDLKLNKDIFDAKLKERTIALEILLILYDRVMDNPMDVLDSMLLKYDLLLRSIEENNTIKKSFYNMYIKVLKILKIYINKEEHL